MQISLESLLTFNAARDVFAVFQIPLRDNDLISQKPQSDLTRLDSAVPELPQNVSLGGQESIAVETPKATASLCKTQTQRGQERESRRRRSR